MAVQIASVVGRADECGVLDGVLADIRGGTSRSLLLCGEAGIGKTALLKHLIEAAADLTVVRAVGVESEMELAFASLHQLCGPMLDGLEQLPPPQRQALETVFALGPGGAPDRFLVGLAVLGLLSEAAGRRPLLCVVDDAQWLDHASALTLAFVARRLQAEPVGIVFAAREPGEELRHVDRLELHGLGGDEARALLESVVPAKLDERVLNQIIAETAGNPLALVELPRGLTATELAGGFGLPGLQGLSRRIEESFARRLETLGAEARRLLLLAAAADEAQAEGLLAVGERVRFRHPLARSAVYRSGAAPDRRAVHLALAEVTDRRVDPDRRAWHLAAAATGPDEQVASELERSAGRAQARGGLAAAAAFLERAVTLTQEPARRVERTLIAARAGLRAGAFDAALGLLATAEAEPLSELERAEVGLLRAQVAFASSRGGAAPALLLAAAKRIERLDARLARTAYFEAMSAALFAARLAGPGGAREVASAVQAAPAATDPPTAADLLLNGWAALFAEGAAAAAGTLREALAQFGDARAATDQLQLLWLVTITAPVVWDEARWDALSALYVELARGSGALSELPLALNSRTYVHLLRGELDAVDALIDESQLVMEATEAGLTPGGALALAVLRGEPAAAARLDAAWDDATHRGEGIGLTVIAWARAVLYNSLGKHEEALAAAREADVCPTNSAAAVWGMVELIEAAALAGEPEAAGEAAGRLAEIARAAGTDWALGVAARSSALVSAGPAAERLYREAVDRLGRCGMHVDAARAHLLYGEWLCEQGRRPEARDELRAARDQFAARGIEGFARRAQRSLPATGEPVSARAVSDTAGGLTAKEKQIARLAREGLSNPEIGARLFLSPRTVEWHLHKVFGKLGIRSRWELSGALPGVEPGPPDA